jgi:nucleoside-diphosphate-sugar epimerase
MKVLVAGATGAIGRQLVPLLRVAGHEVVGLSRSGRPVPGAALVVGVDALDRAAVEAVVRREAPDAVVNMLTAIPSKINLRRMAHEFALTNRLRTDATRYLTDAAVGSGVRRIVAQGVAFAYDPAPGAADEDQPLWRDPPRPFRPVLAALRRLEELTADAGGIVLRLGQLYGPGTGWGPDGTFTAAIRAGTMPIVGNGGSVFSFTHVEDVATATLAALEKPATGRLNIVDDEPTPVEEFLPELAALLGAPAPGRVPVLLARAAAGAWGVAYMTRLRGADNARARLTLDWRPRYPSWRDGFAGELASR